MTEPVESIDDAADPQQEPVSSVDASPARDFPIVGIGASAGGLAAFEAFFRGLPADADPGMAFVLVQHLAPDHQSMLAEIVRRYTRMPVCEVTDGMAVRVNSVHIIPPRWDMAVLNGTLHLLEPSAPRLQRLPIDFFFRSLAQDQHEQAIGIVLSGTGSDGAQGVRAIKSEGGLVLAQSPASTEFDGMPRSALATGVVDFELPPDEMFAQLMAYRGIAFGRPVPVPAADLPMPWSDNDLRKVFVLLRAQTGHDFSQYKASTIHRRIVRRMAVNQIDTLGPYVRFLQQQPTEVDALFRDMLIGVTHFFRDAEAFQVLQEQVVPALAASKPAGATLRVWVVGCSTGEEAYSLAIMLQEHLEAYQQTVPVQVFATDIDCRAIAVARAGVYPVSIAADLTPERLARFFTAEPDGSAYRVNKTIRDKVVFSEHDLIRDPPLSKLDLVACRNLLIYMNGELQKRVIPLFHYALNPDGILFLGGSESIGDFDTLFSALDRKSKLFRRRQDYRSGPRAALSHILLPASPPALAFAPHTAVRSPPMKPPLRELVEQALLQRLAPVGVLVNGQGDILYLHGRSGAYLEPATGEAGINNVLTMARDGLRRELSTTLSQVVATQQAARARGLRVRSNGHHTTVNLSIHPLALAPVAPVYLVILEEAPATDTDPPTPLALSAGSEVLAIDVDARIIALTQALRISDDHLHAANEELETSIEAVKISNEEMQSVNEELQSTNEELETSKEELQSLNEEMRTVNAELQNKVADLSRSNNDMNNLLAGTGIATVFVDHGLRILRFTPGASEIIHLIDSDVGRPVGHLASNLVGYDRLVADTQSVLDTLVRQEHEVRTTAGGWYAMRIQPYRTLDHVIEGAVITFVDISEAVRTREALRQANEQVRLAVVVRDASDAITVQDLAGRMLAWNPGAVRLYGWSEAEALALNLRDRVPPALYDDILAELHTLTRAEVPVPRPTQRLAKDGRLLEIWLTASILVNEAGQLYAIATTERLRRPGSTA